MGPWLLVCFKQQTHAHSGNEHVYMHMEAHSLSEKDIKRHKEVMSNTSWLQKVERVAIAYVKLIFMRLLYPSGLFYCPSSVSVLFPSCLLDTPFIPHHYWLLLHHFLTMTCCPSLASVSVWVGAGFRFKPLYNIYIYISKTKQRSMNTANKSLN